MKVSENVVVRQVAGASLLSLASLLTPDRRNEIAVELSKSLETGDADSSKYIPEYLGRFSLWLHPRELDEVVGQMEALLSSPNAGVVSAALRTIGSMQLLLTLRGLWHCGSVCLGGVWFGVRNRNTPKGLETEALDLPDALFRRLKETESTLKAIL